MMLRLISRILAAVALLAVTVSGAAWAGAGEACACSCMPSTPEETAGKAEAIVVGKALSQREKGLRRVYVFEVSSSYKTRVHQRIEIWTASQGPACGLDLTIGEQRSVVLYKQTSPDGDAPIGSWSAGSCSNLNSLSPMPAAAGPRLDPIAGSAIDDAGRSLTRSPWVVAGWALAGVVVVVGGALAVRRRRRTDS